MIILRLFYLEIRILCTKTVKITGKLQTKIYPVRVFINTDFMNQKIKNYGSNTDKNITTSSQIREDFT